MTITEKLIRVKDDFDEVYSKGYEDGKADNGDFIGVKYSDFEETGYGLPCTADARSFEKVLTSNNSCMLIGLFRNDTTSATGGTHAVLETAYLPDGITSLHSTFYNCTKFATLVGDLTTVTSLNRTFYYCRSLNEVPYMPNLETIDTYSFMGCTGLKSVNIYKKLNTFVNNAFQGCTNLLDIYVPWAEGEVANAPWGAPNASIHYNTQYDENHNPINSEV